MSSMRFWLPFMIGKIIVKSIVCTSLNVEKKEKKMEKKAKTWHIA